MVKVILLVSTFSLLLGCYSVKTNSLEAKGIGKVTIEHCPHVEVVQPPLLPEPCTKIESHGFTGWAWLDSILASAVAFGGLM